jgi:Flp pilus assembly protein TadD
MAKMAAALEAAGGLPVDDLPKTADGRVERSAADARFESYRKAVESDETSWENWYRLAIGYDDSRDRRRAREAMRTAAKLFQSR